MCVLPALPAALLMRAQVGVCSRESSRSAARRQRRVDEVIDGELQIESRTDSFNSEEGFGSPVRNRCACMRSVSCWGGGVVGGLWGACWELDRCRRLLVRFCVLRVSAACS